VFKQHRKAGSAQIVARETHEGEYRRGINLYAPTGLYHHVYDYVADVAPDDRSAVFRATFTELFEGDTDDRPLVGEQARVTFDEKHEHVELDRDALRNEAKVAQASSRDRFEAIAHAAPGTPVVDPGTPGPVVAAPPGNPVVAILQVSLGQAQRKGDAAEVDRLTAKLAEIQRGDGAPREP
jgi:hypothetical protein